MRHRCFLKVLFRFPKHLLFKIPLDGFESTESTAVHRVYVESIKQDLLFYSTGMELLIFWKWNFKTNLEHKPLPLVKGNNIILRTIYVEAGREQKEPFSRHQLSHQILTKCPFPLVSYHAYIIEIKTGRSRNSIFY